MTVIQFNDSAYNKDVKAIDKSENIVTMGQVIAMIKMVLTSIIEAIEKSGDVGKDYLETNLHTMRESAAFSKKAKLTEAAGLKIGAGIAIGLSALSFFAAFKSVNQVGKGTKEMDQISKTPLAQPSKSVPLDANNNIGSLQGHKVNDKLQNVQSSAKAAQRDRSQSLSDIGKNSKVDQKNLEVKLAPSDQKNLKDKAEAPYSTRKDGTYATEEEKNRAFETAKSNSTNNHWNGLSQIFNPQFMKLEEIVQGTHKDDAAKEEYVSSINQAISEVLRSLLGENGSFYGALASILDRLGITNVVMQSLIAASQIR
jgi:hypothetical protein